MTTVNQRLKDAGWNVTGDTFECVITRQGQTIYVYDHSACGTLWEAMEVDEHWNYKHGDPGKNCCCGSTPAEAVEALLNAHPELLQPPTHHKAEQ